MRTMYDSTNPAAIPTTAQLVGGYTDGIYGPAFKAIGRSSTGWDAAAWARFPNSVHVLISALGTNTGTVGDVEPGCMTPAQGVRWTQLRRQAGVDPTIYCNQTYGWGPVRQAFRAAKVAEPHYWVANYDRIIVIPPGAVAKQYANPTLSGGAYDLSAVADFWPGVDNGEVDQYSKDTNDKVTEVWNLLRTGSHAAQNPRWIFDELEGLKAQIAALPGAGGGGLTPAQAQQLNAIQASVTAIRQRVEKDLAP